MIPGGAGGAAAMESSGVGSGGGGCILMLKKSCSVKLRQGPPTSWKFESANLYFNHILLVSRLHLTTRYSHRDSNAEKGSSRGVNFKFRVDNRKNKEESQEEEVEDGGSGGGGGGGFTRKRMKRNWISDEPPGMEEEEEVGILEEAIEYFWIFKVFKSYGWALPPILISWLIASGPKAFLMALALPLGQSALTFAFDKLLGKIKSKPRRKTKKRRRPFGFSRSNIEMDGEEQEEKQGNVKGKVGYQSWVDDNGSVRKDHHQAEPHFGGWDELDGTKDTQPPPKTEDQSRKTPLQNRKSGMRRRKGETPLLLRLLITVFPFLGSWTKLL